MITHEIQPNLRLFELSQITSSFFFSSRAPWQPSATLISKDLEKSWGLPLFHKSSAFKSACLNMAQSEVPEVWLWTTPRSQYGRLVGTDRSREESEKSPCASLKHTHFPFSAGNSHRIHTFHCIFTLSTLFKSLSQEDVQSKALSLRRGAEHSRVEPREEAEEGELRRVADLLPQSVFLQGALIKGTRARLWHPEQTGWVCH